MDDNVKKFLDFLGESEGADYNTIVGGKERITDFSTHPRKVGLTTPDGPSTAAGKYQITASTYDDIAPKLGITDFSPESQDKIAEEIIRQEGAMGDVQNGDWAKAINKLGGRWASLPSSKYDQPKHDWTWAQQRLGFSGAAPQDLPEYKYSSVGTDPLVPSQGPSQAAMEAAGAKRDAEYGGFITGVSNLPTAIQYGFENENTVYNWWKDQGLSSIEADPNWSFTDENTPELLKGIPRDNWDYVLQSKSQYEATLRRGRVMEALKRQEALGQMGGVGVLGTLTGSLVDLPTLAGFIPVVGDLAIVSKTSRLANAVASGLAGAASNVAVDAAMLKYRPLGSTDELYFSALAGMGMGALGGSLVNPAKHAAAIATRSAARDLSRAIEGGADAFTRSVDPELEALRQFGRREANVLYRKELTDAGLELTDRGKRVLDDGRKALVDDIQAIRDETPSIPKFDRELEAGRTPAARIGEEVPRMPGGKPRPSVSAKAMLQDVSKNLTDPTVGPLAARLLSQLVDDVPVYIMPKSALIDGGRSFYDWSRHAVFLRADAPDSIKLHEIAHAATVQKIQYGLANPNTVHGQLASELEAIRNLAREEAAKQGKNLDPEKSHLAYYLKDPYEFTAGLYTGKSEFLDFLASIKAPEGNLLSKVVDVVRKLLGMDSKETNLLLKAMDLTDRLVDTRLDVNIRRPGARPDAPPAVSVHMEPMEGVDVDPEVVKAVNHAGLNTVFGWSFGLEHTLRAKELPNAIRLAAKLIGTTVGYKGHGVVERNAYDQTLQLYGGWNTSVRKVAHAQFNDYFKRTGKPFWQRDKVIQDWNEQLGDYVRGLPGDYDKSVIATGNQIRESLADVVDHINNPSKSTGGVKRGLTQDKYLDEDGNELLTDPLPKNSNYLPRSHDSHKWQQMFDQFGREFMEKWWGGAFKSANPDIDEKLADRFGKWYVRRVEEGKIDHSADFLSEQLRGLDKEALKRSMVSSGMGDTEAQELLDAMFPVAHKGQGALVSNTKPRSAIDETFSMDAIVNGDRVAVTMNNFINTDTLGVLDAYFKRMAGAISLANHVDVYKQSDIAKVIHDATEVGLGSTINPSKLKALRENFQFTFDRLMNRPIEEFTVLNKGMEMWRNFNVIRLMGAAVYNQIQELSQIVGTMGWKATLQAIPQLGAIRRDLLSGKVVNPLLDDIENMIGGAGADIIQRSNFHPGDDWVRELGDTKFNRWLDKADNGLRKFADGTLNYTGMTGMMVQQKRLHAIVFTNHFMDVATKGKKLSLSKERLAWMGLDDGDVKAILDNMRKFATEKTGVTGKKVQTVDFDKWAKADPDSLSKFTTAFQRESRRVVQENDLASQIPMMSKGWAKTIFQFLNFTMHAWNKSLLFGMNHRDFETLSTVMHGAFFASIVYMARTASQMVGMSEPERQEFAARRLSTEQIVANGFGRIAQASLLPNVIDQISPTPIFSGMRTTSDTTDFLTSNPTLSSISTLFSLWRKTIRNASSDNYQFTEKDARSYMRLLPLNNVVGISGLYSSLIADLPKREQVIPDQQQ